MQRTIFWPVASPRSPPNVMIGAKHAKYRKNTDAIDCSANASLKSDKYHGALRLMSFIRPPNSLSREGPFDKLADVLKVVLLSGTLQAARFALSIFLFVRVEFDFLLLFFVAFFT